jgi:hypothetical protein
MKMTKWIVMGMTGLMLTAGSAMAQDQGGAGGGPGGGQGGGRGGRGGDPAQFQKMMSDRLKQSLEISDEDWKAIEPLVSEVQKQQMAGRTGRGGMFGGRGGRGGANGGAAPDANAEVTPATELQKVLDNKNATPEEIKAKVDAYRAKQKASKEALAKAQEALRAVLSARQEAVMILMGMLD